MKKISPPFRLALAAAALSLTATYFLPIWQIDLAAPQYPEGLSMQIWLNKLSGQVEIINGLNHYIGMKHIKAEMFPEFTYLVYVVGAFIALGLLTAVWGSIKAVMTYVVLLIAGGITAMVDFYLWGYDYGHNLDPTAAIQIPGFSYQPPLIGHKQLLNFDAYSYPASGGWIIIVAALTFISVLIVEWRRRNKFLPAPPANYKKAISTTALVALASLLTGCSSGPQAFAIGKDGCHFCKMTIMTEQFGAEILTQKGKVFKFDDIHCLKGFLKSTEIKETDIAEILSTDFQNSGKFVPVTKATFLVSESLRSPMNSHTAGFASREAAEQASAQHKGKLVTWAEL